MCVSVFGLRPEAIDRMCVGVVRNLDRRPEVKDRLCVYMCICMYVCICVYVCVYVSVLCRFMWLKNRVRVPVPKTVHVDRRPEARDCS
jgi:hypothetical protein